ncbi:MAG: type II toxin-antitoxin system VapC family toxin [Rhodospirillales bacterium]|nr:type II toxin-antitoxin system VapC family toxin [Rhodospirillales bacterium]
MSFDLQRAERALKPQARGATSVRQETELRWAEDETKAGVPLLIDTTVYLDTLQGRTPAAVDGLLRYRSIFHSAVCLAELTHAFGRLDPAHSATKKALTAMAGAIDDIPRHRLFAPDADLWGKAGMLAGKALRMGRIPPGQGQERKLLNDSLIFLQARKVGAAILTRNVRDFDLLEQLVPSGAAVFYRWNSDDN